MDALETALSRWAARQVGEPLLLTETAAELSLNLELRLRVLLRYALRLAPSTGRGSKRLRRSDVLDALESTVGRSDTVRRIAVCTMLAPQKGNGLATLDLRLQRARSGRPEACAAAKDVMLRRGDEAFELERFHSMELLGTAPKKPPLTEEQKAVVLKLVSVLDGADKVRPSWPLRQMKDLDSESLGDVAEYLVQPVPKRVAGSATDAELLYLLDALELVATTGSKGSSSCATFLHLCFAPILVLCLGQRGQPGPTGLMSWSLDPGNSVSRRAADLLARLVALHHDRWPQLGLEVLQLLREALHRRPPWRALQGLALCLMHFGPKAIKELLDLRHTYRGRHDPASGAPAVLAVMEALRLVAADHLETVMEHREQLAKAFGVHPELLLLVFGNLADARVAPFARGQKRKRPDQELATPPSVAVEVAALAQANQKLVLAQRPRKRLKGSRSEQFSVPRPLMADFRLLL